MQKFNAEALGKDDAVWSALKEVEGEQCRQLQVVRVCGGCAESRVIPPHGVSSCRACGIVTVTSSSSLSLSQEVARVTAQLNAARAQAATRDARHLDAFRSLREVLQQLLTSRDLPAMDDGATALVHDAPQSPSTSTAHSAVADAEAPRVPRRVSVGELTRAVSGGRDGSGRDGPHNGSRSGAGGEGARDRTGRRSMDGRAGRHEALQTLADGDSGTGSVGDRFDADMPFAADASLSTIVAGSPDYALPLDSRSASGVPVRQGSRGGPGTGTAVDAAVPPTLPPSGRTTVDSLPSMQRRPSNSVAVDAMPVRGVGAASDVRGWHVSGDGPRGVAGGSREVTMTAGGTDTGVVDDGRPVRRVKMSPARGAATTRVGPGSR
jgi:hypothetical protein